MPGVTRDLTPGIQLTARWAAQLDGHVIDMAWSPRGEAVAAVSVEGLLIIVDRDSGASRVSAVAHAAGASSVSWHPRDPLVVTGGHDGRVTLWDAASGTPLHRLDAGTWVERVAWSPSGASFAVAAGRTVRLFSPTGELVRTYPTHRATVTDLQWQPWYDRFCTTSYGGVTLFDPTEPEPLQQFSWQGSSLVARWSPDGKYIATGDQDSTVHFWKTKTGQDLMMSGYRTKVRELAWDHSSRFLATGGSEEVAVWDCSGSGPSGTMPIILPGHETRVSAVAFQYRGPRLASGGDEGHVVLWHPGHKRPLVGATGLRAGVTTLAWAPDDKDLLVGCANGDVRLLRNP